MNPANLVDLLDALERAPEPPNGKTIPQILQWVASYQSWKDLVCNPAIRKARGESV